MDKTKAGTIAITSLVSAAQVRRLTSRTDSFLDRPAPVWVRLGLYFGFQGVRTYVLSKTALRVPTAEEDQAAWWLRTKPHSIRVCDTVSSPSFVKIDSTVTFIAPPSFFTLPQGEARQAYYTALSNSSLHSSVDLSTLAASMLVERAVWTLVVGDREALSFKRAVAFNAAENARTFGFKLIRNELNRRGAKRFA